MLVESGRYSKDFANGLITGSGSIGLLFPPSLPLIIYAIVAKVRIDQLFILPKCLYFRAELKV